MNEDACDRVPVIETTPFEHAVLVQLIDVYPGALTTWELTQRLTDIVPDTSVLPTLESCEAKGWIHAYAWEDLSEQRSWSFRDPEHGRAVPA